MDLPAKANVPSLLDETHTFYGTSGMKFPNYVKDFGWDDLEHFIRLNVSEVAKNEFTKAECEALVHALFNYEDCISAVEEELKHTTSATVQELCESFIESEVNWDELVEKNINRWGKEVINEVVWETLETKNDYAEILDRTVQKVDVLERLLGIEDEDCD